MPTIREVANRAGVSVATVSRVINKTGFVSESLAQRVELAMSELSYQPSDLARGLRSQKTMVIGVLIPQLDQPFFGALCYAIERTLFDHGYRTLICSAQEKLSKETSYVTMFLRQRIDGAILVPTGHSIDNVRRLLARQMPVVIVDRDLPSLIDVHRVLVDNFHGAYQAISYLIGLGHRRIGVIASTAHSDSINHRLRGAAQAFDIAGLPIDPDLFLTHSINDFDTGYALGRELLQRDHPPTAIFALTDIMAIGAIHAAAQLGRRVPEDVSIMGFDGVPLGAYMTPELSTVEQPIDLLGVSAGEQLIAAIESSTLAPAMRILNPRLLIRKSTAAPTG